ncbi:hypothetical protein ACP4OV_009750 [Aristida adscensionis]
MDKLYWPRPSYYSLTTDPTTPALVHHGFDPGTLDPRMDLLLCFLYASLPWPPAVSAAASLSCAAAASDEGVDRISGLPDDLLRRIVSRLPAKDGARTTALSSRWRRVWRSAPLVLVDAHLLPGGGAGGRPARRGAASAAARDAVSAALRSHPGPFPFASLTCGFIGDADADRAVLARWFHHLATKGVDELVLVNRPLPLPGLRLPAALFSCAFLRRLYLGAWVFPDTAGLPRGAAFPNLRELVLGAVVMEYRDLQFVLAASPVLESLAVVGNLQPLRARLASRSLRSAQFVLCYIEEVAVVDAPSLDRLFFWRNESQRRRGTNQGTRIKIARAPQLHMLGYLEPGVHVLEIGDTVIKSGTKPSPVTTVPSVRMLALSLHFGVSNEVKMLPSFLRCFPNVETLCIESQPTGEPTGNLNAKFWQKTGPADCVRSNLKVLVFREFQGEQSELDFLMYVAQNAQVLESMLLVLKLGRYAAPEQVAEKYMALESARWASGGNKLGALMSRLRNGVCIWNLKAGTDLTFGDPFLCF